MDDEADPLLEPVQLCAAIEPIREHFDLSLDCAFSMTEVEIIRFAKSRGLMDRGEEPWSRTPLCIPNRKHRSLAERSQPGAPWGSSRDASGIRPMPASCLRWSNWGW